MRITGKYTLCRDLAVEMVRIDYQRMKKQRPKPLKTVSVAWNLENEDRGKADSNS